jgi:hypothetical protein
MFKNDSQKLIERLFNIVQFAAPAIILCNRQALLHVCIYDLHSVH